MKRKAIKNGRERMAEKERKKGISRKQNNCEIIRKTKDRETNKKKQIKPKYSSEG